MLPCKHLRLGRNSNSSIGTRSGGGNAFVKQLLHETMVAILYFAICLINFNRIIEGGYSYSERCCSGELSTLHRVIAVLNVKNVFCVCLFDTNFQTLFSH